MNSIILPYERPAYTGQEYDMPLSPSQLAERAEYAAMVPALAALAAEADALEAGSPDETTVIALARKALATPGFDFENVIASLVNYDIQRNDPTADATQAWFEWQGHAGYIVTEGEAAVIAWVRRYLDTPHPNPTPPAQAVVSEIATEAGLQAQDRAPEAYLGGRW